MALKNNIGVHYFACLVPMHVFFVEDGLMEKGVFLATWKDISNDNEKQFEIHTQHIDAGTLLVFLNFHKMANNKTYESNNSYGIIQNFPGNSWRPNRNQFA